MSTQKTACEMQSLPKHCTHNVVKTKKIMKSYPYKEISQKVVNRKKTLQKSCRFKHLYPELYLPNKYVEEMCEVRYPNKLHFVYSVPNNFTNRC